MLYKIIAHSIVESLEAEVNSHLDQGWELYGYFQVAPFVEDGDNFGEQRTGVMMYQPLIQRESLTDKTAGEN